MSVSTVFASVGANRTARSCAWSQSSLFAYAAGDFVAVWDEKDDAIVTLSGHKDRVVGVHFLEAPGKPLEAPLIVSTSADKTLRVWRSQTLLSSFTSVAVLDLHHAPVISSTCYAQQCGASGAIYWIFSGDSMGTNRIWVNEDAFGDGRWVCVQSWTSATQISTSAAFVHLGETLLLAVATTKCKIDIYALNDAREFVSVLALTGHENWITNLAFTSTEKSDSHDEITGRPVLLASASQDKYIRLWHVSVAASSTSVAANADVDHVQCMLHAISDNGVDWTEGGYQLSTRAQVATLPTQELCLSVLLDSILLGHDDWVYSVTWSPDAVSPRRLLSTSADKSMIIWQMSNKVWEPVARVGEVGGSVLGFYCGAWSPSGDRIAGVGYSGAIHLWKDEGGAGFKPCVGRSGHTGAVTDLTWDPTYTYLVTTSSDRTTRAFAPWVQDGLEHWREIARIQIHGYDLNCLTFVNNHRLASGADEKVLRIFDTPRTFVTSLAQISRTTITAPTSATDTLPVGASVPALGLSNKAVFEGTTRSADPSYDDDHLHRQSYTVSGSQLSALTTALSEPPTEEHLLVSTLWPEVEKLYGHAHEVIAVASTQAGDIIACACKAANTDDAVIRLFNTTTWKELPPLKGHALSVTRLRFSPSDQYLLSVSRDRSWTVWRRSEGSDGATSFVQADTAPKSHARIIWDCCWTHDNSLFATASRDSMVKIWRWDGTRGKVCAHISLVDSVTAVAFAPQPGSGQQQQQQQHILACGLDNGQISLYTSAGDGNWTSTGQVPASMSHVATVRTLAFRYDPREPGRLQLASCSDDHSVRLFSL